MLAVRLDEQLEKRLNNLSKNTGRSKSYYVKKAIEEFLDEREDVLLAVSRSEDSKDAVISLEEMRKKLGLDG